MCVSAKLFACRSIIAAALGWLLAVSPVFAQRSAQELAASMDEATGLARDGLSGFLAALDTGTGEGFAVKVPAREHGPWSHVWLVDLEHAGGQITGVERLIAASGIRRTVTVAEITDWTYRHDGFTHGAFTSCVANASQPPLPFD